MGMVGKCFWLRYTATDRQTGQRARESVDVFLAESKREEMCVGIFAFKLDQFFSNGLGERENTGIVSALKNMTEGTVFVVNFVKRGGL